MGHYDDQYEREASSQVGGSHYKSSIQPVDYIKANNLDFFQGNIIKYVTRHKSKGGIEDLRKAKHYLDMLIQQEREYGKRS